MKKNDISRRDFLKGTAVGTASVASLSLIGGCAPKVVGDNAAAAPEVPTLEPAVIIEDSQVSETIEKDVVIIGCGPSGMYCAMSAKENGLDVAIVAKDDSFSAFGGSHFVFNSKFQQEIGHTVDVEQAMAVFLASQDHKVNQKNVWTWANRSGEAMDWLIDKYEPYGLYPTLHWYDDSDLINGVFPGAHAFYGGENTPVDISDSDPYTSDFGLKYVPQVDCANAMMDWFENNGVEVNFEHECVQLNRDEDSGKVTAIVVKDSSGAYKKFIGTKGIVIASGSYGANQELVDEYCPQLKTPNGVSPMNFCPNDGAVMKQALAVGAAMQRYPDHPAMLFAGDAHPVWNLLVNKHGERFVDENLGTSRMSCSILVQLDSKAYAIWDDSYADELPVVPQHVQQDELATPDMFREKWDALVEAGAFFKCDTIEELAEKLELPVDALVETVDKYNAACDAGSDDEFHKKSDLLFPLEAPFYGGTMGIASLAVMGGLHVNERSQVLDINDRPLENLYAIGLAAGDFYANTYTTRYPGNSLGRCLTFGYLLGRELAGIE